MGTKEAWSAVVWNQNDMGLDTERRASVTAGGRGAWEGGASRGYAPAARPAVLSLLGASRRGLAS